MTVVNVNMNALVLHSFNIPKMSWNDIDCNLTPVHAVFGLFEPKKYLLYTVHSVQLADDAIEKMIFLVILCLWKGE